MTTKILSQNPQNPQKCTQNQNHQKLTQNTQRNTQRLTSKIMTTSQYNNNQCKKGTIYGDNSMKN